MIQQLADQSAKEEGNGTSMLEIIDQLKSKIQAKQKGKPEASAVQTGDQSNIQQQ